MTTASILPGLKRSLIASAGTIVFGMEDGTVSIFGLIFGVAATTSSSSTVLVAGASGAAAAAVSMMAGAYLDAETSQAELRQTHERRKADLARDPAALAAELPDRLAEAGLTPGLSAALAGAVKDNPEALKAVFFTLQSDPETPLEPRVQALWMLLADFLSAAVPIVPFILLPIPQARVVSAVVTLSLLVALGVGRALIAKRSIARTVAETVSIGIAAALAGVGIGVLINRCFNA